MVFIPASLKNVHKEYYFVREKVLCNEKQPESESERHGPACGPGGGGGGDNLYSRW